MVATVSFHPMAMTLRSSATSGLARVTVTVVWAVWGVTAATCLNDGCDEGVVVVVVPGTVVVVEAGTVVVVGGGPPVASKASTQSDAPSAWTPGVVYGAVAGRDAPLVGSIHRAVTLACSRDRLTATVRAVGM